MATSATSATTSSNIDVSSIVSQLMTVERQPIAKLDRKEASYQAKLSAYGNIKGAVASFQTAVQGLNSASKFQAVKATPSDATIFSASASSIAVAGTYSLEVTSLAQAQKLVTAGQTSSTAAIGAGATTTLTFDFGTIAGNTLNATTGKYGMVLGGASTTSGSAVVTVTSTANLTVGAAISGTGIPAGATIASIGAGSITLSGNATASGTPGDVQAGGATSLGVATTTSGSKTVTVSSTANLSVGAAISGTGIPAGATIASIDNATQLTLSVAATTGGAVALQAGTTFTSSGSGSKTVTIDSTNNSLQGIRDAINAAGIGVTATIINDGSASPYRLALSSDSNGVSSSMKISVDVPGALRDLLAHDPAGTQSLSENVTAQNANFKVNGVAASKTSNTVSDVVAGVTLNLSKVTTSPVTLTVARDTGAIGSSISGFVKAYNDLAATLKSVSAYDPASKQGAILQGDSTVRSLQSQMRSVLSTSVAGTSSALRTLSDIGVSFQKDGTLALNQTKLDSAIASNFSDIAGLFAATGKATDSLVSYASATSNTKAGSYAVNVTQVATRGGITGNLIVPANNTIASGTTMSVSLDGISASVALTAGDYTPAQLAAMIQSAINGTSAFSSAGSSVAATIDGSGFMSIVSNKYGSTSNVSISNGAGTVVSTFMGGVTTGTAGNDVAGSIGGIAATGSGQTLSAAGGDALGLSISVNAGAPGAAGTVNYSHGYACLLDKWAASNLASGGSLAGRLDGIGKSIADIGEQRTALQNRLVAVEKRYRTQFSSLDVMLSSMNQTSTYLTQQLAQLSNLK